jgi:hypothetical protein
VKRLWFALVSACLSPVVVAGQVTGQQDVSARLAGHVPPAVVSQVQGLADTAVIRGLPVDPLVNKALEGAVKGAPPDRIVAAVRTVLQQLDLASDALRPVGVTSANAIEAGAFAIAAGLDSGQVATVARSADRAHPAATALQVVATLVALGVPPRRGVGLVQATIRAGEPLSDLVSLPSRLQVAMAGGLPPAAAAEGLERAALNHLTPKAQGHGKGQGNPHRP